MHNSEHALPPAASATWADRYLPSDNGPDKSDDARGVDLAMLRGFVWRQRFVLSGVVGALLVIGFVVTLLMRPVYEAASTVRVDPEGTNIIEGQDLSPEIRPNEVNDYLATLVAVIKSRSMALLVVDSLKLDRNAEFNEDAAEKKPQGLSAAQWKTRLREAAAHKLMSEVKAEVPMTGHLITISYNSLDPALAAAIVNAYTDNFATDDVRRSLAKNDYALRYLQSQIKVVSDRLRAAEQAALAYARANKIVGQSLLGDGGSDASADSAPQTITAANLASVNSSLAQARETRIAAEQRWIASQGLPASQLPEVQQNSAIQGLVAARSQFASQLAEMRTRYGEAYPQVAGLRAQVDTLDRQIEKSRQEIKTGMRQAYEVALRQEQALSGMLDTTSNETLNEQERRVQFNALDREVKAARQQLGSLLERYNQISSAANIRPGTITKIDEAIAPTSPVSPDLKKNLLISLVLGIAFALAIAVLREAFDDRMRSMEDVQRKLSIKALGQTPIVPEQEVANEPLALSEAYSTIRTSLDFVMPKPDHNVLQFTSSQASEGKTTTSIAIARRYARLGKKVLLVDTDLRKPSVSRHFGTGRRPTVGVVEVLLGQVTLQDALLPSDEPNLDVLPVGAAPPNTVDFLSSALMAEFVKKYRDEYSLILFDSPPVMGLADAPLLSRLTDGVVFIIESNRAHFGQAKTALRRMRDADAHILGAVLTKFHALDAGHHYDYHYTYYTYGDKTKD